MAVQNVHLRWTPRHPSKERIVAWKMHSIWCGENSSDHFRTTNGDGINTTGVEIFKTRRSCWHKHHSWVWQMYEYLLKDTHAYKLLHSVWNKYYYIIHVDRIKMCNCMYCMYTYVCISRDVNCRKPGVWRHICGNMCLFHSVVKITKY